MIDQLEENLTLENYAGHMEEIHRLAKSRDTFCRIRLADLLGGFPNRHAKKTLLALTGDASYLVQTSAIDSLSAFPGDETPAARLLRMFGRCNYRNQCAILNSLSDLYPEISRSSQERIRRFCQELADKDMYAAVQEAYDRLIHSV